MHTSRLWIAALVTFAATAVHAQSAPVFNEYGGAPQAWRPAELSEPGVDAKGDLNLDLPILTVPGRGGLGYDIRFQYASSVRFDQPSSWIGGGWFFDPGSITRDVHAVVVGGTPYLTDFTTEPAYQPDQYQVTLPIGTSAMVRTQTNGQNGIYLPPRQQSSGFALTSYRAWKVDALRSNEAPYNTTGSQTNPLTVNGLKTSSNGSDRVDYVQFVVTDERGTRYVFENPTIATYVGVRGDLGGHLLEQYASMWRLRAILGPDYDGDAVPTGTEAGSWVLLRYEQVRGAKSTDSNCTAEQTGPLQHAQRSFLTEIVTPTHRATFTLGDRDQENFPNWQTPLQQKLTKIELYAHGGNTAATGSLVRTVTLSHLASGFESPIGCGRKRRLALGGIAFAGWDGTAEPGYTFSYVIPDITGQDTPYVDHFGYYDTIGGYGGNFNLNKTDGAAWSLASITYPTGGRDEVTYENDELVSDASASYGLYTYTSASSGTTGTVSYTIGSKQTRQGGARVTSLKRYDGLSSSPATTTFGYGSGRLSGVPSAHWKYQFQGRPFYAPVERGRVAVFYDSITRKLPDGAEVKTLYTTPSSAPAGGLSLVRAIQTVAWKSNGNQAMTVAQGNQDWNWGLPYKTEYREAGTSTLRRETETTPALSSGNLIIAWSLPNTVAVEWGFAGRVTKEVERDYEAAVSAATTTTYTYADAAGAVTGTGTGNNLLRRVDVAHEDGRKRRTTYTYAYEKYQTLADAHRLADRAREDVAEVSTSGTVTYHASSVTTYKQFPSSPTSVAGDPTASSSVAGASAPRFLPYQSLAWSAAAPSTSEPSFMGWTSSHTPTSTPAGWELVSSNNVYNAYGYATSISDARGGTTLLTVNGLGQVTRVQAPPTGGVTLARDYTYHARLGTLASVTDENGGVESYGYDDLGRLTSVTGRDDSPSLAVAYTTTTVPHKIRTTRYTGGTPASNFSDSYYDGLGRLVQTQDRVAGATWAVTATEYSPGTSNAKARERTYRPYTATTSGDYATDYATEAVAHYGTTTKPYTDTELARDGTGRTDRVVRPYEGSTAPTTTVTYGAAAIDGSGPVYRTTTVTEGSGTNRRSTLTYTDAWGRDVRVVEASGSTVEATTHTVFDAMDQPVEVQPPNYFDPPSGSSAAN